MFICVSGSSSSQAAIPPASTLPPGASPPTFAPPMSLTASASSSVKLELSKESKETNSWKPAPTDMILTAKLSVRLAVVKDRFTSVVCFEGPPNVKYFNDSFARMGIKNVFAFPYESGEKKLIGLAVGYNSDISKGISFGCLDLLYGYRAVIALGRANDLNDISDADKICQATFKKAKDALRDKKIEQSILAKETRPREKVIQILTASGKRKVQFDLHTGKIDGRQTYTLGFFTDSFKNAEISAQSINDFLTSANSKRTSAYHNDNLVFLARSEKGNKLTAFEDLITGAIGLRWLLTAENFEITVAKGVLDDPYFIRAIEFIRLNTFELTNILSTIAGVVTYNQIPIRAVSQATTAKLVETEKKKTVTTFHLSADKEEDITEEMEKAKKFLKKAAIVIRLMPVKLESSMASHPVRFTCVVCLPAPVTNVKDIANELNKFPKPESFGCIPYELESESCVILVTLNTFNKSYEDYDLLLGLQFLTMHGRKKDVYAISDHIDPICKKAIQRAKEALTNPELEREIVTDAAVPFSLTVHSFVRKQTKVIELQLLPTRVKYTRRYTFTLGFCTATRDGARTCKTLINSILKQNGLNNVVAELNLQVVTLIKTANESNFSFLDDIILAAVAAEALKTATKRLSISLAQSVLTDPLYLRAIADPRYQSAIADLTMHQQKLGLAASFSAPSDSPPASVASATAGTSSAAKPPAKGKRKASTEEGSTQAKSRKGNSEVEPRPSLQTTSASGEYKSAVAITFFGGGGSGSKVPSFSSSSTPVPQTPIGLPLPTPIAPPPPSDVSLLMEDAQGDEHSSFEAGTPYSPLLFPTTDHSHSHSDSRYYMDTDSQAFADYFSATQHGGTPMDSDSFAHLSAASTFSDESMKDQDLSNTSASTEFRF